MKRSKTPKADAVYVRKSTDPQEERSQVEALRGYLDKNNIVVPEDMWFTDTGSRHRPEDRADFQRLMKLVESGKIGRVFIWKQDRLVSGIKLWFKVLYSFEQNNAQLIDILTGKNLAADDIATEIETAVRARGDRDFQANLSQNVQRAKVALAKKGTPFAKHPTFGYDKKYTDSRGNHLWTAHLIRPGRWLVINPDGSSVERESAPRKSKTDQLSYTLSHDKSRIELVRYIFETYANESITERAIALRLNQAGRLHYGRPWLRTTILDILKNPTYRGHVRNLEITQAEFTVYDGDQFAKAENPHKQTRRTPDRTIVVENQHEAIVDQTTWEIVQRKLTTKKSRPQPPRRDDLWLRGVLVCARCRKPMHTFTSSRGEKKNVGCICASYYRFNQTHAEADNTGCTRNWISHEKAEGLIRDRLGEILTATESESSAGQLQILNLQEKVCGTQLQLVLFKGLNAYLDHVRQTFTDLGGKEALARIKEKVRELDGIDLFSPALEEDLQAEFPDGSNGEELIRKYFFVFEEERTKAARAKVEELKAESLKWLRAKVHAEDDRERAMISETLRGINTDITKWEEQTVGLDDQLAEVRSRLADVRGKIAESARSLTGSENRRKAELVRAVFSRVVLHFRTVQKAKNRDCVFESEKTEFVTNLDDGSSRSTTSFCASPHRPPRACFGWTWPASQR